MPHVPRPVAMSQGETRLAVWRKWVRLYVGVRYNLGLCSVARYAYRRYTLPGLRCFGMLLSAYLPMFDQYSADAGPCTSRVRGNPYALRYDAQNLIPGPASAIATLARWGTGAGDVDHRISDYTYAAPGPSRAPDRWPHVSPRTPK